MFATSKLLVTDVAVTLATETVVPGYSCGSLCRCVRTTRPKLDVLRDVINNTARSFLGARRGHPFVITAADVQHAIRTYQQNGREHHGGDHEFDDGKALVCQLFHWYIL